jgi:hypothetical protein
MRLLRRAPLRPVFSVIGLSQATAHGGSRRHSETHNWHTIGTRIRVARVSSRESQPRGNVGTSVRDLAGSAYGRFRRALDGGNATIALAAAADLEHVGLVDALELLREKWAGLCRAGLVEGAGGLDGAAHPCLGPQRPPCSPNGRKPGDRPDSPCIARCGPPRYRRLSAAAGCRTPERWRPAPTSRQARNTQPYVACSPPFLRRGPRLSYAKEIHASDPPRRARSKGNRDLGAFVWQGPTPRIYACQGTGLRPERKKHQAPSINMSSGAGPTPGRLFRGNGNSLGVFV